MIPWNERTSEEQALLAPCFSALLLWKAAFGYGTKSNSGIPFDITFLVLPIVLHKRIRKSLPKSITTSLAFWVNEHPIVRSCIADRARVIIPFTKEALIFGSTYGLLNIDSFEIKANQDWKKSIDSTLKETDEEVQECAKRAEFVGKWFAGAGTGQTIMSLMGVRP